MIDMVWNTGEFMRIVENLHAFPNVLFFPVYLSIFLPKPILRETFDLIHVLLESKLPSKKLVVLKLCEQLE